MLLRRERDFDPRRSQSLPPPLFYQRGECKTSPMGILLALAGLFGGLLLSALFWYVTAHVLVPELVFASAVSKRRDLIPGCVVYRLKIENSGRRPIIDVSLRARIHFPGYSLRRGESGTSTILEVPLDIDHLFALKPRAIRILWLDLHRIDDDVLEVLDPALRQAIDERRDAALEGLLEVHERAYLRVQALAYDAFSGARKYFSSPRYGIGEGEQQAIHEGKYRGLDVTHLDGTKVHSVVQSGTEDEPPPSPDSPQQ